MKLKLWWRPWWLRLRNQEELDKASLTHSNIFLWPSRYGVSWLAMASVLFIFGVNYQNNLVILFSFFLISLFITNLVYSYRNLAGLELEPLSSGNAFSGETIHFVLQLSSERQRLGLMLRFVGQRRTPLFDLSDQRIELQLPYLSNRRGPLKPGPILIESRFPMGLCRARAKVHCRWNALVWAKPDSQWLQSNASAQQPDTDQPELSGLAKYQPGESKSRVAWKQLAQNRGWYSKQFDSGPVQSTTLSLDPLPGPGFERKVRQLSAQIEWFSTSGLPFSLVLPGSTVNEGQGERQRQLCQNALAALPIGQGVES
ncbi:DUF58 domain-containing protein [Paraferrimonas sedimenticola]|uniref:DUF58 domain-containing protein n=1 Tax=Paraferrimonas sedimenticola TaxID=375674 RepID=A0AA37W160_9GAMM|nr:DUF58 domain-containing protein [Paraferrimonas sedimenticola]GLP96478.1 DUF58 domain-containing protein [Paraferrimonas sedimenticola]